MATDLYLARRIQELDQRIDALTREIDGLPKHVEAIESRLASHRQELANTQSVLAENAKQNRQLEGKIEEHKQKISRLQDQMNGAKTNAQFRAFQHEIKFCKDSIDELEENILDKMEQAEALEESVSRAREELKAESAKVAAEVERAREQIETDKLDRERQRATRAALSIKIDPLTMREYERIRMARGVALAEVVGETCSACHVRLRPKFLQDLQQLSRGILTCESCGLIAYLPDEGGDGVPLEDPAWE